MIIGIDLGTTNSSAAVWLEDRIQLIPNTLGNYLTPSVVGIEDSGNIIVGEAALERLTTHPDKTAATFKRYMGTSKEFILDGKSFRPEELSSLVLSALKKDAELFLNRKITEAVITVPAYFNDTQRKATRIAGELAGLKVERLLNEPTSAALAYGLHQTGEDKTILVFDLGGGTFDVSILEFFDGVMEVRASAGDNFLGGEDFRKVLTDHYIQKLDDHGISCDQLDPVTFSAINREAEKAKKQLSNNTRALMTLDFSGKTVSVDITRDRFETLGEEYISRIKMPLNRVINDANLNINELDAVILVGGATRMPLVTQFITKMLKRFPSKDIDPDLVVAMGASVQGALKEQNKALDEVVLTDICPYTLGIEIVKLLDNNAFKGGRFLPIIERNTVIPTSRVDYIVPIDPRQRRLNIKIYQGESYSVTDNIFLGSLDIPFPITLKDDEKQVEVRFTYDVNGILEVEGKILTTDTKHTLVIEENPGALSQDQIQQSLKKMEKLKIHPREQSGNMAIISRAERLFQETLGEERHIIADQLTIFQTILEKQNPEEINTACREMTKFLDAIEHRVNM